MDDIGLGKALGNLITLVAGFLAVLYAVVGTWSVSTVVSWFGHELPLWSDVLLGLLTAPLSFPIAIVGSLLQYVGVF